MPLPMVHLSVAKKLTDTGFPINDLSMFFLGSISPDAIHMRQGIEQQGIARQSKMITHLLPLGKERADIEESAYIKIVNEFIRANQCTTNQIVVNRDFLLGYAVHVLTDVYWENSIWRKFKEEYEKSGVPIEGQRKAYYSDTDIIDYILYKEAPWQNNIWQHLQNSKYFDFLDLLSAKEIELWSERVLNFYDSPENQYKFKGESKFITQSDIESFVSVCVDAMGKDVVV